MQQRLSTAECASWIVAHDPIKVIVWDDSLVEQHGHSPRSAYVETYWLPLIGPASTWAMRRLATWLDAEPDGYSVSIAELGRELGLGAGTGRSSPVVRTLARLVLFGLAVPRCDALAVRRMLAPLTCRQVGSLPEPLVRQHDKDRDAERISRLPTAITGEASASLCRTASARGPIEMAGTGRRSDADQGAVRSGALAATPPARQPNVPARPALVEGAAR